MWCCFSYVSSFVILWTVWCICLFAIYVLFFFFKQKTAYEMRISDWSSDVCSSDLGVLRRILIVYRETAPKLVANSAGVDAAALANAATIFRTFGERYQDRKSVV